MKFLIVLLVLSTSTAYAKNTKKKRKNVKNSRSTYVHKSKCYPPNAPFHFRPRTTTGDQKVIIKLESPTAKEQKPVVKYRTKIKEVPKETLVYRPNRLQFTLGLSKTNIEIEREDIYNYRVDRTHERDMGLQYLHDVGYITFSASATMNENYNIGLGFNW